MKGKEYSTLHFLLSKMFGFVLICMVCLEYVEEVHEKQIGFGSELQSISECYEQLRGPLHAVVAIGILLPFWALPCKDVYNWTYSWLEFSSLNLGHRAWCGSLFLCLCFLLI
jgi:hypothetical protein